MFKGKSIVCVIPARLASARLPRKMVALLNGKPLLQCTYEAALAIPYFDQVIAAVDSKELFDLVTQFGGKALLTDPNCQSGTERLIELQQMGKLTGDIWVNWQGDEPFITSEMIDILLQSCDNDEEEIWTLKRKIENEQELASPSVVKVVCDAKGRALYFSRSLIPYLRDVSVPVSIFKHAGIYAFSQKALKKMAQFSPCELEQVEALEQLRFLYHGLKIQVHETTQEIIGVNTAEELLAAQRMYASIEST